MSWADVAGKEFRDAGRSWQIWGLTVVFSLFFLIPILQEYYLPMVLEAFFEYEASEIQQRPMTDLYVLAQRGINSIFVPLIAIIMGYGAISNEYETGSLKLLLSLPHSRRDIIFGKIIGRTGVVGIPIIIAYVLALPLLIFAEPPFEPIVFVIFGALTIFLAMAFVSIAVGISAVAGSNLRSAIAAFGVYVWFHLFWDPIAQFVPRIAANVGLIEDLTFLNTWFFFDGLSPLNSYEAITQVVIGDSSEWIVEQAYAEHELGAIPFYITVEFQFLLIICWVIIPVALGGYLFTRRDL